IAEVGKEVRRNPRINLARIRRSPSCFLCRVPLTRHVSESRRCSFLRVGIATVAKFVFCEFALRPRFRKAEAWVLAKRQASLPSFKPIRETPRLRATRRHEKMKPTAVADFVGRFARFQRSDCGLGKRSCRHVDRASACQQFANNMQGNGVNLGATAEVGWPTSRPIISP